MIKSNIKYILWIIIFFLSFILFNSWQNEKTLTKNIEKYSINNKSTENFKNDTNYDLIKTNKTAKEINIETNLISAKINLHGGNISFLSLKKYSKNLKDKKGINIFNTSNEKKHFSNSGFLLKNTNYNDILDYSSSKTEYNLDTNNTSVTINLKHKVNNTYIINKVYIFKNYSYEIDVKYYLMNISKNILSGKTFGYIAKQYDSNKGGWFSTKSFQGTAMYTDKKKYKKITLDEIEKNDQINRTFAGWLAHVDNYFLSTWIPSSSGNYIYSAEKKNDLYILKYINENETYILPSECICENATLFVGPKIKDYLTKLHKGLDLSIDYGIFWPIAITIFLLLSKIYSIINNWGFAIIVTTIMIKLLFFHLSSISYKSLGHMKKIQPKLDLLKEQYKENKKELSSAIIELYKKEKINPLSGCLPILIQIPVFISLYYVLLESVELRHAPFILWINDLSAKDSYYILPVIMSLTMFIQQKLNPPIQDPVQQKVMMFMPLIFLIIFLQFPSGLVLYWVINNILSILQQWIITKNS